ncbi:thiamine pyrophosphokinase [Carpediemonas membranifera]|uniref:Thiamine pyrophosphokinase n=1 Tax=Carpediemonas membranifera TaxID=201153 RepID=A0A8J6B9I9_9EUKA|nr:thiamine pyrophosphokinase [Carpediemonas membranifera]|eukprot:KAG9396014.1 thiamine pyrophosphokinase [Carpediemonas membranifera]
MIDLKYVDNLLHHKVTRPLSSVFLNWRFPSYAHSIFQASDISICADGGANRLLQVLNAKGDPAAPSHVVGDLDSLDQTTLDDLKARGSTINRVKAQDDNDFAKSLTFLARHISPRTRPLVAVVGASGGRLDHTLANISTAASSPFDPSTVHMFSEDEVTLVLPPGVNKIILPDCARSLGILPVFGPSVVSTSGFQWDVSGVEMAMGGFISSSNKAVRRDVVVKNSRPVCFTACLSE